MPDDGDAIAVFDGVGKRYGDSWVLRDVRTRLPVATTAIVGASGSGKTTLLQMINAMVAPDEGSVAVFGSPVPERDREAFRRRIGYAVQGGALFPHLNVLQNMGLVARLTGWNAGRIEARARELVELTGLPEDVLSRYPDALSGGQQQRVSLCRALFMSPELLLLDEPFSALDPITRMDVYDVFRSLRSAADVAVVLVTHDMREAVRLADYLIVLRSGLIVQQGRTASVVETPADDYVERLVAEQL